MPESQTIQKCRYQKKLRGNGWHGSIVVPCQVCSSKPRRLSEWQEANASRLSLMPFHPRQRRG
jgi:hypothetical protein